MGKKVLGKELVNEFNEVMESMGDPEESRASIQRITTWFEELLGEVAARRESVLKVPPVSCTRQDMKELSNSFSDLVNVVSTTRFSRTMPGRIKKNCVNPSTTCWKTWRVSTRNKRNVRIMDRFEELLREAISMREANPDKPPTGCTEQDRRVLIYKFDELLENMGYWCPVESERLMQKIANKYGKMSTKWDKLRETMSKRN
ncbi:hypothetical protein MLD38_018015 [Melastoma candidum]|uniref:Uncharacterized protein n=1 Tax=Melastoma candidum TaxID=119954 RepID=A0ACB9QT20_9MYRT|nr:hypothetical protein MLD38_018015 [Melastoma candidum]